MGMMVKRQLQVDDSMTTHNERNADLIGKKQEAVEAPGARDSGVNVNRVIDDPQSARTILDSQELQNMQAAVKHLLPMELAERNVRGTSMQDDYVDGSALANPDELARLQIDSLTRTLPVWEERLQKALDDFAQHKPHSEEKLAELLDTYAAGSKNMAKYMTADQKRELMEMAEKATDALLQKKLADGDYQGAHDVLAAKLAIDANLTLNAPKPHHHLLKDLKKMVELCNKYNIDKAWYWEDKLEQEQAN